MGRKLKEKEERELTLINSFEGNLGSSLILLSLGLELALRIVICNRLVHEACPSERSSVKLVNVIDLLGALLHIPSNIGGIAADDIIPRFAW